MLRLRPRNVRGLAGGAGRDTGRGKGDHSRHAARSPPSGRRQQGAPGGGASPLPLCCRPPLHGTRARTCDLVRARRATRDAAARARGAPALAGARHAGGGQLTRRHIDGCRRVQSAPAHLRLPDDDEHYPLLAWSHPEYSRRPQDKYKYSILPTILCPVSANTHALNPTLTILNTRHHHYTPTQNTYAQNILAPFA